MARRIADERVLIGSRHQARRIERRELAYWQLPLAATDFGALSPAHFRSQVDPVEQASEHEPAHVMWHVELPAQLILPLAPSVTVQVDPESHAKLHEAPQLPLQSL